MSVHCLHLAIVQADLRPTAKLVLLAIADSAQEPWAEVEVSLDTLRLWSCAATDREIMVALGELAVAGCVAPLPPVEPRRVRGVFTLGDRRAVVSAPRNRGTPQKRRALRAEVFARDGHRCHYCGSGDDLTLDHKTPLVKGGTNDLDNLLTACRLCNCSKGKKGYEEFLSYRRMVAAR